MKFRYSNSQLCSCVDSANCNYPSGIYPYLTGVHSLLNRGTIIPPIQSQTQLSGLYTGCLPLDSLLASTLECFYQLDCITSILNTSQLNTLNSTMPSKYDLNVTIGILVDELFIENISINKDFEVFFQECQLNQCTYSFNSKGNLSFILTTIISLFGGLFMGLKILSLLLINIVLIVMKKIKIKFSKTLSVNIGENITTNISLYKKIKTKLHKIIITFNIFKSAINDEHGRRNEIISTRIYLLFMIVSIVVIISHALIVEHTLIYQVENSHNDKIKVMLIFFSGHTKLS